MKVIDLLNKIANDEEVPIKFIYKGYLWEYDVKNKMWFYYFGKDKNYRFDSFFYINQILNNEVEIIEPQEHKIPKKLDYKYRNLYGRISQCKQSEIPIIDKINEILDYLEEIK